MGKKRGIRAMSKKQWFDLGLGGRQIDQSYLAEFDDYANRIRREGYICEHCGENAQETPPDYLGRTHLECKNCGRYSKASVT
jgi:hypothetical protein